MCFNLFNGGWEVFNYQYCTFYSNYLIKLQLLQDFS